jgi:oligopeptide/dipeptide ABC transporter ATP-binding protein
MSYLLEIKDLSVKFQTKPEAVTAVDGISLKVNKGEKLGIVGESGSGKTVTAMTIMGLLGKRKNIDIEGQILLNGDNLLEKKRSDIEKLRGSQMSMIFQDPVDSLNPVFRIGDQVAEAFIIQEKIKKKEAWGRAVEQLTKVGIRSPKTTAKQYPYQLSGGMCQRTMIALALAANPPLLIADEPTTDLDVTIQAQIFKLIEILHQETGAAILLITHDLGVVCQFCQRIAVMLSGRIVEIADVEQLFKDPRHPYTIGLLNSIPVMGKKERLKPIPAERLRQPPGFPGCKFASRCALATERCQQAQPDLRQISPGHEVACFMDEAREQ